MLGALDAERETPIKIGQNKYLNNVVEQDHQAIIDCLRTQSTSHYHLLCGMKPGLPVLTTSLNLCLV